MSNTKLVCKLYKMKDILTLSKVQDSVLNRTEVEKVKLTKIDEKNGITLTGNEAVFNYSWISFSEIQTLRIPLVNTGKSQELGINFIKATANIEYSKQKKRNPDGTYLPKKQRTNEIQIGVYFININGYIYTVVCSSQEVYINRVRKLIGLTSFAKMNPEYTFESDFFNWLFYQYAEKKGVLDDQFLLMGISGFMGNITDEQNVFKGKSQQTSELIITKAFISNGETLKNITARIRKENEIDIVFGVDDKCNTVIQVNRSEKLLLFDTDSDVPSFLLVYLYGILIPKLHHLYLNEKEVFIGENEGTFSTKIGLEVIHSIIDNNNIPFSEIKKLYSTKKLSSKGN